MINEKLLSFMPKLYMSHLVVEGIKADSVLSSLDKQDTLLIASASFLKTQKKAISIFSDCDTLEHSGEPSLSSYQLLKKEFPKKSYSNVIGIGGGSVLDIAKLAKKDLNAQLIAIPTTIGSGAEVSPYAVLVKDNRKTVLVSRSYVPDVVILNPEYPETLESQEIAYQGLDALSHAIEGLVSRMAHPLSDMLSIMSIDVLYTALSDISTAKVITRETIAQLQQGALFAGVVQGSVGTGIAHSFAHYYGPKLNISHAQAISIFLPETIKLNMKRSDKYKKLEKTKSFTQKSLLKSLHTLYKKFHIQTTIRKPAETNPKAVLGDICTLSNPVKPTEDELSTIEDVIFV